MNKTVETMQPLRRSLPEVSSAPEIDEDGEEWFPGFQGDFSQSPLYVTDGHILLLASAIDPAITIRRHAEFGGLADRATEAKIENLWKPAEQRDDVIADFIGVGGYCESREVAFLRDVRGRVMVVNALLLAFCFHAVHPDTLTVSGASFVLVAPGRFQGFDTPLALRRDGKLVGLLMPMRLSADDFQHYDMHGEPVSLA